ncbi:hypothetical protein TSACC_22896 [Terrimicrobium sacchariphilum]|uniref:PsbP C-terminal domain-containing protein n=1 Tax=Terrimicrobium sacchariphilum TaxID=690879 RepID=A0A146GAM4_TERSA|nr:hypothetical protein [Terrimicrobium sacchariphilum]GAT34471.1 hypothetical protein TSACC_22896 [Terrimicrobium sacchariphilum]
MKLDSNCFLRNASAALVGAVFLGGQFLASVNAATVDLPQYGFSIDALDAAPSGVAATTALITFLPPSDGFAPNVNVNIQPYPGNIASYAAMSKGQFESMKWTLISEKQVSGNEWMVEYTGATQGANLHFYARAISKSGKVYLVTGTAKETQWSTVSAVLRKHVDSFQVK